MFANINYLISCATKSTSEVNNVLSLSFSGVAQEAIDNFYLGDTKKTKRPNSQIDYGTVTAVIGLLPDDTEHQLLIASATDGSTIYFDSVRADGTSGTSGEGFVSNWQEGGMENGSNAQGTFEITINDLTPNDPAE